MSDPKPDTQEETTELLIWDVPIELKIKFKSICAERKVSMKETIIKMMTDFVNA